MSEEYLGGLASSAIAKKWGLSWKQGYAIYLTSRRIIVAPAKTENSLRWTPNTGSLFGSFGTKVTPFIDEAPPALDAITKGKDVLEIPAETVSSIELKKPGSWIGQGSVRFVLSQGRDVKMGLLGGTGTYNGELGSEVCDRLAALFRSRMPGIVKLL